MYTCPALRPRRDFNARPVAASPYGLPSLAQRRLPRLRFLRGSITQPAHSLSTLRRADYSNPTQDSLPVVGQTLPVGIQYPMGSYERFQTMHPPFPGLPWRKPGGRGRLLAPGSHRSGRAGLPHPAPRIEASLSDRTTRRTSRHTASPGAADTSPAVAETAARAYVPEKNDGSTSTARSVPSTTEVDRGCDDSR